MNDLTTKVVERIGFDKVISLLPKRIKLLSIIPDDILFNFPFPGVFDGKKFLIQKFRIQILPRYNIHLCRDKGDSQACLFGIANGFNNLPKLPNIKAEIESIKSIISPFCKVNCFLNEEATKDEVIQGFKKAKYLHLASHGSFSVEEPLDSGVLLANNDLLSIREVIGLGSGNAPEFISVSSCWAADKIILQNRWIISLPESFWIAGCKGVLGNLWSVEDEGGMTFIKAYYKYFRKHEANKALQKAQIEMINSLHYADPYNWAGFQLYGNCQSIKRSRNNWSFFGFHTIL